MLRVPAPYNLICAVQDLHDLYQRAAPTGPYRLPLFAGEALPEAQLPEPLQQQAAYLDGLVRGATCLLANQLAPAALPVIAQLWRGVQLLEQRQGLLAEPAPEYYAFLTRELAGVEADAESQAYRLLGEVLAVYLDVLCVLRAAVADGIGDAVQRLRAAIAQTGERSSAGRSAGGAPPAS